MKKLAAILFVCLTANSFSQTNIPPQFSELKGMEDQLGNTHLFYRIYEYFSNQYGFSKDNSIYHIDLNNFEDTLFLRDYIESNPVMFNALSVNDFKFWNNHPNEFIYVGVIGGQDPVPFINRFDQPNNLLNYFCCEIKTVDISSVNDSLIYAGGELYDLNLANTIRSMDGGFYWTTAADTLSFISLNPFNDNFLFLEGFYGFLYRSTDAGNSFTLVDEPNQWAFSSAFNYDSDQLHIYRLVSGKILRVSSNLGEPFSWQTKYSSDSEIFISIDESTSGTIYLADKKNIFISTDFGNNFSLYNTLDRKIVGIYKKPNSNKLYAATKYKIYEITPDTVQIIKSLPIPEDAFDWLPLDLADKWIYINTFYGDMGDSSRSIIVKEVVGYKTIENHVLNQIRTEIIPIDTFGLTVSYSEFFRVDSLDGLIYQAWIENDSLLFEELYMDLIAEVGDTIPIGNGIYLASEEDITIYGLDSQKRNFYHTQTPVQDIQLVKGLGLVYKYVWELVGTKQVLKGCLIAGVVYGDTTTVGVDADETPIATEFRLEQNYPNPFNPSTKIKYQIPASLNPSKGGTLVQLIVYDILGNQIATLVNEEKPAGEYEITFNASGLPSGIYFYQLRAGNFIQTKKMVYLK